MRGRKKKKRYFLYEGGKWMIADSTFEVDNDYSFYNNSVLYNAHPAYMNFFLWNVVQSTAKKI